MHCTHVLLLVILAVAQSPPPTSERRTAPDSQGIPGRLTALEASVALLSGLPASVAALQTAVAEVRSQVAGIPGRLEALEGQTAQLRADLVSAVARLQALEAWRDALACSEGAECSTGVCAEDIGICESASCDDGVRNGGETGVDCGGSGGCGLCPDGDHCHYGSDCASGVCRSSPDPAVNGTCAHPTCIDGIRNGAETDVDCGGGQCARCSNGRACAAGDDCESRACIGGVCVVSSCDDGARDGAETDVDCGGPCPQCAEGRHCAVGADCTSSVCSGGMCTSASCTDQAKNGQETDVDCGGASCPKCASGRACAVGTDCQSGTCALGVCSDVSTIRLAGDGYRQWSDGTFAASCEQYIRPLASGFVYAGDTGDGAYRIQVLGNVLKTWCDMTTRFLDGSPGGWTLAILNSQWPIEPTPNWYEAVWTANIQGELVYGLLSFDYWLGVRYWQSIGTTVLLQIGSSPHTLEKQTLLDFTLGEADNYAIHLSNPRGQCEGGESYDYTSPAYSWDSVCIYNNNADSRALCAVDSPSEITQAKWAMLFTPPAVPYRYDSVCMRFVGASTVANASALTPEQRARAVFHVHGEVSIWPVVADRQSDHLRPGTRQYFYRFEASWPMGETPQPHWVTVVFNNSKFPMIAWQKGVYVGVEYWACRKVEMTTMRDPTRPIHLVWNADNYVWKQVYGDTRKSSPTRAIVLRTTGHAIDWKKEVPETWTECPAAKYGDGVCNCECGEWDVDCRHNQTSPDCTDPNAICDQSGTCVGCSTDSYWAYDGCQCECPGISDPDCWDLFQNVSVCSSTRKVKYGPRPLNVPIDIVRPNQFVDATVIDQNIIATITSVNAENLQRPGVPIEHSNVNSDIEYAMSGSGQCEGGESYDDTSPAYSWDSICIYNNNADSRVLCALDSPNEITQATWAMLFTPPEVPFVYDSVCMLLVGESTVANASALTPEQRARAVFHVHGEVSIWSVLADRQSDLLRPGRLQYHYSFEASWPMGETPQPHWVTVPFTQPELPMIAWRRGVYVGVEYWACRKVGIATMRDPSRPIRLVWNADNYIWKQVYGDNRRSSPTRAIVLRTTGHALDSKKKVPPSWTRCAADKYGDGVCNCDCGEWDIDCTHNQTSPDCADPNAICDQSGTCVVVPWAGSPGCSTDSYWAYDGCQCECPGISDPDCWDLFQNVSVCTSSVSQLSGLPASVSSLQTAQTGLADRMAALEARTALLVAALETCSARVQALEAWRDALECSEDAECASRVCAPDIGICVTASCDDGVRNGAETDVDCGGYGGCRACPDGARCEYGSDCVSGVCAVSPDPEVNGTCGAQPTCSDAVRNGAETDVDCGGPCPKCADGRQCAAPVDCRSAECIGGVCALASCADGTTNGAETDVDCGGPCPKCANAKHCLVSADCTSGVCVGSVCAAPRCNDATKNGDETDVDCGGPCQKCTDLKKCSVAADCTSGVCMQGQCRAGA
eukprot:m51a1_g14409 hypothetical protein (1465) ;mRNA; r:420660-430779